MSGPHRIILSAGGTGGHLFPAEALAHELGARGWEVHLATDSRAERFAGKFPAKEIHQIASATIGGRNPIKLAQAGLILWKGFRQSAQLIEKLRPSVVVGFGGYPTLPPLYAATRRGVRTVVHEQNAVMGRANKALAPRVTAVAGGFLPEGGPFAAKIVTTGNPVRPGVLAVADKPFLPPALDGPINFVIFGGSQGARFFSDVVPDVLAALPAELRTRLVVTQQARAEDQERVTARYAELGVTAEVSPFFNDLPARVAGAHLVLSRAGASTVLELSVIGRPSILVPLPHALDDDQGHNAQILVDAGGAIMHRQATISAPALAAEIAALLGDSARLSGMAAGAKTIGRTNATRLLADLVEAIAAGTSVDEYKRGRRP